jgi:DNA-binding PadR family transcriptional regulator
MSTKHAVLGLLVQRRDYGYRLRLRLEQQLGIKGMPGNAVYRALVGLQEEGMIREIDEPRKSSGRGSPRVMYEATEQGVASFEAWLRESSKVTPLRDELHIKIAASTAADLNELIGLTWEQERECLAQLRDLEQTKTAPQTAALDDWPRVSAALLHNAQIAYLQATVESLQRSRTVMERVSRSAPAREGRRSR